LFAAFAGHVPTSAYNATLEAESVCCTIRSSVFCVENLVALGFRNHLGQPISLAITAHATTPPAGISYFAFRSPILPNAVDARLSIPNHFFEFWLALPLTMLGAPTPPALTATETARKGLEFNTPNNNSAPPPAPSPDTLVQASDIVAMDPAGKAALGTASSHDIMSDYASDCFLLLSAT
jgi:hypothetical protein